MNTLSSSQHTVTDDETLIRIARSLGHPAGEPVTLGALEGRIDTWIRAMAMIGRHVGADSLDPMKVAEAVEDRIAGRPPPSRTPAQLIAPAVPVPVLAPTPVLAAPAAPAAAAPAVDPSGVRALVHAGQIFVELGGVRMRVTACSL